MLTDDLAAIKDDGDVFHIIPAYPRIRLWPESVEILFGSTEALPRITPTWEKCFLQLDNISLHFEPKPVPLAAIYFLHPRTNAPSMPAIDEEPRRNGLVKLIGNIGSNYILDQVSPSSSFDLLRRLAHSVPLRRLIPHADAAHLPRLREMVVSDIRALHVGACVARNGASNGDV